MKVTSKTLIINLCAIAITICVVAVAAHFALRVITRHSAHRTVPQLKGISLSEAELIASQNDLKIIINDSLHVENYSGGTVLDQLPVAGVQVKPGRTIYIVINAFNARMVNIPYVAGRSLRQAKNMLDVAGFEISQLVYVNDMATNYVLGQNYKSRTIEEGETIEAPVGSGITLTVGVSERNPRTITPNIVGLSFKEAKSRLWESGINVGRIDIDGGVNLTQNPASKVLSQGYGANQMVTWGATMNFTLSLNEEKIAAAVELAHKADLEYAESLLRASEEIEEEQTEEGEADNDDDFFSF